MISIIIPVYNVKLYLDNCIQSVIQQSYTDFECILVDDGSTDGSSEICDQWAEKDNRIIIVHQPNGGVSSARNKGLEQAKGEYICFIDSDDWVDVDYLSAMINNLKEKETDLIICGLTQEFKDRNCIDYIPQQSLNFELGCNHTNYFVMLNEQNLLYGPIVKLYKNNIIQTINNGRYYSLFIKDIIYGHQRLRLICTNDCGVFYTMEFFSIHVCKIKKSLIYELFLRYRK